MVVVLGPRGGHIQVKPTGRNSLAEAVKGLGPARLTRSVDEEYLARSGGSESPRCTAHVCCMCVQHFGVRLGGIDTVTVDSLSIQRNEWSDRCQKGGGGGLEECQALSALCSQVPVKIRYTSKTKPIITSSQYKF